MWFAKKKGFSEPQRFSMEAAAELPTQAPPKVKNKQQTFPSHLTSVKPPAKQALRRNDRMLGNIDITTYRTGSDSRKVIYDLVRASPDLSAATTAYVRTGVTEGYKAFARNMDGSINPEATGLLKQIINRMDILNDYEMGFDDTPSLRSLCEIWAKELVLNNEACGELVLDKARVPDFIQPISTRQIEWFPSSDGKHRMPKQKVSGEYVDLNVPTFFTVRLDEDILEPYAVSGIESAIQPVLQSAIFQNDVSRVMRRAIHPRVDVAISQEEFMKTLPQDVKQDQKKLDEYMEGTISAVEQMVNDLEPEDALVHFDSIEVETKDHGNTNMANEYTTVQGLIDSRMVAGTKTMPVVLGKGNGTSNTASVEAVMFVKYVAGTVTLKLNEILSKIFTLAVRLMGQDVYVQFCFNPIDLRPENELEAFKALKQSRILALNSLGWMSDEEACIELTGNLPPAGAPKLMGTGYMPNTGADPAGDGYNGASNGGSTNNQSLNKNKPTGVKSQNGGNKKAAEVVPLHQN